MTPLRIGVNALYLIPGKVGGTEIYLRNALETLAAFDDNNQYFIFRNRETGPDLTPPRANFHDRPQPVSGQSRPARILYEQFIFPFAIRRARIDVLWNAGFTAPLLCGRPMITVFHDLQYRHHPEFFRWFDLPFWRILLPASARRSRRILVLSDSVQRDVQRFYGIPESRIDRIPHSVETEWSRIAEQRSLAPPQERVILTVSTLHPHKNLDTLLSAFRQFLAERTERAGWRLWIVGLKGFDAQRIERLQRELGLLDAVIIAGWIPREELYRLFANASAFVYPSRFEGFGIPVLEALTAGVPVACSRIPSLVEIAGNAARYFDPLNQQDLVEALVEIVESESLRARLRVEGPETARRFSRRHTAERLVEAFRKTAQPTMRSKNAQD